MGGEQTRQRILEAAQRLFAEKGFDGTGVDAIARSAQVTKSLIYHHFGDKRGLLTSLFDKVLAELDEQNRPHSGKTIQDIERAEKHIGDEIAFMDQHRHIVTSLLMESLKEGGAGHLFKVAERIMIHHLPNPIPANEVGSERHQARMIFEFFTGFLPLVMFIALRHQWCRHYGSSEEEVLQQFEEAFTRTHLDMDPTGPQAGGARAHPLR